MKNTYGITAPILHDLIVNQKYSHEQCAAHFGCSRTLIGSYARKYNIRRKHAKELINPIELRSLIEVEHWPERQCAKHYGVSQPTIGRLIKDHGIKPNKAGQQKGKLVGPLCHSWKGGAVIDTNGYRRIKMPDHPSADNHRYVLEHRYVMELMIGRLLRPEERVHHIDENKLNNSVNNLMLFATQSEHQKHHAMLNRLRKQAA